MNGHSSHLPRLNYGCKIECLQCTLSVMATSQVQYSSGVEGETRVGVQVFRRKFHTHIHLD